MQDNRTTQLMFREALHLYHQEQFSRAFQQLEILLALQPHHLPAQFQQALCKIHLGQEEEAYHDLCRLVEQDPGHHQALAQLAQVCFSLGDKTMALVHLHRALESDCDAVHRAEYCFIACQFHSLSGEPTTALEWVEQAIMLHPQQEEYLLKRARLLIKLHHYAFALNGLNQLLQQKPLCRDAYFLRALCRKQLNDNAGAHSDMERFRANRCELPSA
jgi:tetratricopeptide (TPR) repeat protein